MKKKEKQTIFNESYKFLAKHRKNYVNESSLAKRIIKDNKMAWKIVSYLTN